ncbi:MAG TPA: NAD-dependent epimerase/dehydratase family protein [Kineosporiaceae bacterium]|jgi:dTDP-L-rhamnose 4-epimerase|nr:NAD-dependent epimerase/dehydratase family protein [Kineosporiaceae bacterium]
MRVLVTGGAGFIGSQVVRSLVAAGHEPVVLDAMLPAARARTAADPLPDGVRVLVGDVRDAEVVDAALDGADAVCHQAAMVGLGVDLGDLPHYVGMNDLGTAVVLAGMARAGVRSLVLAGSMVVYGEGRYTCDEHGDQPAPPRRPGDLAAGRFELACPRCDRPLRPGLVPEDARPDPRNVYAVTKLTQELLAAVWARETGGAVTTLRYHNVYGPGLPRDTPYAGVAALFRSAIARGEAPRVFEDGGQRRDFVHVRDVAAANVAALETTPDAGGVRTYNVGSGVQRTVLDLATALADALDGPRPVVTGEYRLGDVRHVTADTARIRAELGWLPAVDFTDGMKEFAAA